MSNLTTCTLTQPLTPPSCPCTTAVLAGPTPFANTRGSPQRGGVSTTAVLAGHTQFANARETPERGDENPTAILTGPSPTPDARSITRGKSDMARTPPPSSLPAQPRTSPVTATVGQQRQRKHHCRPRWTHTVCERKGNPQRGGETTTAALAGSTLFANPRETHDGAVTPPMPLANARETPR